VPERPGRSLAARVSTAMAFTHDWGQVKSLRNLKTNRNITIGLAEKIFLSVPVSLFLNKSLRTKPPNGNGLHHDWDR
jgi:hypothetical protein